MPIANQPVLLTPALSAIGLRPQWIILLQVIGCTTPASLFLYRGSLALSVFTFYGTLGTLLTYYAVTRQPAKWTALIVGCLPMLMLLRPVFYQNSISVILAITLGIWLLYDPRSFSLLQRDRLLVALVLIGFCYWWISVLSTGFYATNLRVFELIFGGCCVSLLSRFRSVLTASLWGIAASTLSIVISLWRYSTDRLGLAEVGSYTLGHPQQVGMAASLTLVLCLADGGRWLSVNKHPGVRYFAAGISGVLLLLTTSRTSWLLLIVGLIVLLLTKRQRRVLIPAGVLLVIVTFSVLVSSRGDIVLKYINKVTDSKRTLSQRTTGRYDQYSSFPDLFWESPIWGFGPGSSGTVYHNRSGESLMMHSLVLHLGVETGIIGLAALFSLYGAIVRRSIAHRSITNEIVPLIAAASLCVDGLAHNSFNSLMGVYMGLAVTDLSCYRKRLTYPLRFAQIVTLRDAGTLSHT